MPLQHSLRLHGYSVQCSYIPLKFSSLRGVTGVNLVRLDLFIEDFENSEKKSRSVKSVCLGGYPLGILLLVNCSG